MALWRFRTVRYNIDGVFRLAFPLIVDVYKRQAEYQAEKYIGKPLRSIPGCCSHNAFDDVK